MTIAARERGSIPKRDYAAFSARLFEGAARSGLPLRGQIELTYRCNLRCVHCYTDCHNHPADVARELPRREILRILDAMHRDGCLWLCLTGGEIFRRPDFFGIYDHAQDKGFLVTLFTNVTTVTRPIADRLAERRPFAIETSCHGGSAAVFDAVTRVPGSFARFCEGVRLLLDRGLPLKVKTKAMTLNRGRLGEIRSLLASFGLPFHVSTDIYPDLAGSIAPASYRLSPEEIVALEGACDAPDGGSGCRAAGAHGADGDLFPRPPSALYRCGCGSNSFIVDPYGRLGSCVWSRAPGVDLAHAPRIDLARAFERQNAAIRARVYPDTSPCRDCRVHAQCDKKSGIASPESGRAEDPVGHFCETAHARARRLGLDVHSPFEREGRGR
ncbi:MAG: radical SAM protein [Planctomycetes bacterium]|nr:radical SAM protein [Planctomycetota bacterium]